MKKRGILYKEAIKLYINVLHQHVIMKNRLGEVRNVGSIRVVELLP